MRAPLLLLLLATAAVGKVFTRCELARELRRRHGVPADQVPVWVCIAEHESGYNTSAVGRLGADGSGDHGLFQISDLYWCSPPGRGWACGVSCAELEDDDIADDVACARRVFREHQRLSGNGFAAWAVYRPRCTGVDLGRFVHGCFDDDEGDNSVSSAGARANELVKRRADLRILQRNIFLSRYLHGLRW
ncbi:lysozyme 2-like [Bacillus rossius redtenbacheri]|uniref:lysozyme 2-like n=1 Tax=Bacillus rossius redtenbacheri TaxID=93214 RepID=UPI002FDE9773